MPKSHPKPSPPKTKTLKPRRQPRSYTPLSDALSQPLTFADTELAEGIQRHSLASLLAAAMSRKRRSDGEPLTNLLCALLVWPLLKVKSIHCFCAELCQILAGQVSVLYDLLGREDINWRGLLGELARKVYQANDLGPRSQCAFVVDDTSQARAGRKVEGTSSCRRAHLLVLRASDLVQKPVVVPWWNGLPLRLNPTNGAVYWSEPTVSGGSPGFSAVSTPVIQGDRLLVSGLMFQLDGNRPTAKVLWPDTPSGTRRILSDTSTPFFKDDFVYSPRSGGAFVCLDAGRDVKCGKPTPSPICGKGPASRLLYERLKLEEARAKQLRSEIGAEKTRGKAEAPALEVYDRTLSLLAEHPNGRVFQPEVRLALAALLKTIVLNPRGINGVWRYTLHFRGVSASVEVTCSAKATDL